MEQGLLQRHLRTNFKLDKETYANWEKDRCYPAMEHWPAIIAFLGYDPTPSTHLLSSRLLKYRRTHGMSRSALAKLLEADEATVWRWEMEKRLPTAERHLNALERLFKLKTAELIRGD